MDLCLLHGLSRAVLSDCVLETLKLQQVAEMTVSKSNPCNLHAIICDYHHSVFCPQNAMKAQNSHLICS